ncbi:DUF1456 family protein [Vibrio renipiscarius]|uniref:DUF1456 domain-containing protein n=1 Tax=Vibrio renipiscarius TaxID=1461322 RepID=A0A0C2N6W0_9VIBR|nr:DUF1456 family protein [Vibrio renipiscarius]KII75381.1 hypothetical protein OJ16_19040 [Vibrio renipiscarius]KII78833.1 hypothetical protein PL18_11150 [Vibrio renipiscarius]
MTNNDILRRIRYIFDFNDKAMIDVFALADLTVSKEQVSAWLKKDEDEALIALKDVELAVFLNGFISLKRGKREGEQPQPEQKLNNNMVFQKLRIALNLKAEDILEVMKVADFNLSKHELSAFFRKPENKHYRECKDQMLRNFLTGVQIQLRPNS